MEVIAHYTGAANGRFSFSVFSSKISIPRAGLVACTLEGCEAPTAVDLFVKALNPPTKGNEQSQCNPFSSVSVDLEVHCDADPPLPHVLANRSAGDVPEYALFNENGDTQFGAPCPDVDGGCFLVNPLDSSVGAATFDALDSIDPRRSCNPPGPELSYHWEIFYPPGVQGGVKYTSAGISGYFEPVLTILQNSLPSLVDQGADRFWRMRLTLISNVQPTLTTVATFRFRYDNSELTVDMSTACQAGDPTCKIPNAGPAPCGRC